MSNEFKVRLTRSAARDLCKLPRDVQARVRESLEALRADPELGKALTGELKGLRSYQTSSYRLIYQIQRGALVVLVIAIGHRREVYEKARRRET